MYLGFSASMGLLAGEKDEIKIPIVIFSCFGEIQCLNELFCSCFLFGTGYIRFTSSFWGEGRKGVLKFYKHSEVSHYLSYVFSKRKRIVIKTFIFAFNMGVKESLNVIFMLPVAHPSVVYSDFF